MGFTPAFLIAPMFQHTDSSIINIHSCLSFKWLQDEKVEDLLKTIENQAPEEKEERHILCKNCYNKITSSDAIIEINGKHKHTFYNPDGIIYQIGCFSSARGCVIYGRSTSEFTWFSGFSWCFANCANCHMQLGWYYQSGSAENFYGFILNKLIEGF